MDWSKTKSIFIIVFLILDIFLLSLFFRKVSTDHNLKIIDETSIEEQLKAENISYDQLQKEPVKQAYMSANTKVFTADDLKGLKDQKTEIIEKTTIQSSFDKPFMITANMKQEEVDQFVKNNVFQGDQYELWQYDQEKKQLIYYQSFKDYPLFKNLNAELTLFLNEKGEISSYKQTMLEDFDEIKEKENTLTPIQALESAYKSGKIPPDSEIEKVELGYYTLVPLSESQVLTPTWHFLVKKGGEQEKMEDLFVNAFEGQLIEVTVPEKEIME